MSREMIALGLALCTVFGLPLEAMAQYCRGRVPIATAADPAISSSGDYGVEYGAWKVFDAEISSSSMWLSEPMEAPAWIVYDLGVKTFINHYRITYTNGWLASRAPKDFSLQGWSGEDWITVDSRTGQTGWLDSPGRTGGRGAARAFNIVSPGSYTKYRLHITEDNDHRADIVVISIGELELIHSDLNVVVSCEVLPRAIQCVAETTGGTPPYTYRWDYSGTASLWDGDEAFSWSSWLPPRVCVGTSTFKVQVLDACGVIRSSSADRSCD